MKIQLENGKYVVYAHSEQEAQKILKRELSRFEDIRGLMSELVTKDGKAYNNFIINTSNDRINIYFNDEESLIYDEPENATTKGEVRKRTQIGNEIKYDLAYRYPVINGVDANFRLAHEMGHLMLNPSNSITMVDDEELGTTQVSGFIRYDKNTQKYTGLQIQENAINLLAQLATRGDISADDIISGKEDVSEFNNYKRCDKLVNLLAVSMRNDFDREMSFEELVKNKIDSKIQHSDGTQEPANLFFYSILSDSKDIEKEWNRVMAQDDKTYRWELIEKSFEKLHNLNLPKEQYDQIYELVQDLIVEFAEKRYQEKYKEAVNRKGKENVPSIDGKIEFINKMIEKEQEQEIDDVKLNNVEQNTENEQTGMKYGQKYSDMYENGVLVGKAPTEWIQNDVQSGYHIENNGEYYTNQKGEIVRPLDGDVVTMAGKFGYVNQYGQIVKEENLKIEKATLQKKAKLSFSQKIALFLQKNSLLMKVPFVEKYVDKKLMLLPLAQSEEKQYDYGQPHRNFVNLISNNGKYSKYKNLSKEQIKEQRAIIAQIEQNLKRIEKREQKKNDQRY